MPQADLVAERLSLIRRLPVRARIAALSAGLEVADGQEVPALAAELLGLAIVPPPPRGLARLVDGALGAPAKLRAEEALWETARRWSVLDSESRMAALAIGRHRWRAGVLRALEGNDAERRGALRLIAEACDAACVDRVVDLLCEEGHIAKSAESTLVRMAGRFGGVRIGSKGPAVDTEPYLEDPGYEPTSEDQRLFEAQLVRAADSYEAHRRPGVLLAALLTLGPPSRRDAPDRPLLSWVRNKEHPAHASFLAVIRRSKEPLIRSRAWLWLIEDGLGGAAIDRLSRAETSAEHDVVLKSAHLLLHPLRARRTGLIKVRPKLTPRADRAPAIAWPANCVVPSIAVYHELSPVARRNLPRWLRALDMHPIPRSRAVEPLLADHDPSVRLACVRVADSRTLSDLCFDGDARVARGAALKRSNAGEPSSKGLTVREAKLLSRHPARGVRAIGRQEWERGDFLDGAGAGSVSVVARIAARRAMVADREAFLAEVHRRLTTGSVESRIGAISLVRWLGIAQELEVELLACLGAEEEFEERAGLQLIATAVSALGAVRSPTAQLAVRRAMQHEADRVRANAVEAVSRGLGGAEVDLAGSNPRTYASMIELKSDRHHRVRANAIRALLHLRNTKGTDAATLGALASNGVRARAFYEPAGTDELFLMLADERVMHRVAGLWLVERISRRADSGGFGWKIGELCSQVARLANSDPDERVRSRATRCAQWLIKETQRGWGQAALDGAENDQEVRMTPVARA